MKYKQNKTGEDPSKQKKNKEQKTRTPDNDFNRKRIARQYYRIYF